MLTVKGHIETMDLGAWVPVDLVTFVLGRPPSRYLGKFKLQRTKKSDQGRSAVVGALV